MSSLQTRGRCKKEKSLFCIFFVPIPHDPPTPSDPIPATHPFLDLLSSSSFTTSDLWIPGVHIGHRSECPVSLRDVFVCLHVGIFFSSGASWMKVSRLMRLASHLQGKSASRKNVRHAASCLRGDAFYFCGHKPLGPASLLIKLAIKTEKDWPCDPFA